MCFCVFDFVVVVFISVLDFCTNKGKMRTQFVRVGALLLAITTIVFFGFYLYRNRRIAINVVAG